MSTTKEERDELDTAILEAIKTGVASTRGALEAVAKQRNAQDPMRASDRSLQRLRKAGKINWYPRTGWSFNK